MTLRLKVAMTLMGTSILAVFALQAQETVEDEGTAELAAAAPAARPDSADDYVAVWLVIEQQWESAQRGEKDWVENLLAADFIGWPNNAPHPRDKASTRRWNEFGRKQSKGLEHEIFPLETVIHGDTAIAHYLYSNATETREGETRVTHGRYTDVLVRVDGRWQFIAWHGGDDDQED